jgi:hypothetical protein
MNYRILIPATCLLVLAGCNGSKDAVTGAPATVATAPSEAAGDANQVTVAAVREGSGNAAVRVRFLMDKPLVVGQESQVRIDFSSYISGPVTLDVNFAGNQLQMAPEAMTASISLPRSGEAVTHLLALTPGVAGLSELKVHLKLAGEDGGSGSGAEASYVIPVLADKAGSDKPGPAGKPDNANP